LAKKILKKLSIKDKKYNEIKDFARNLFINTDMNGCRHTFPEIAKKIGINFAKAVNPETIRTWSKNENWIANVQFIIEKAEKEVAEKPISKYEQAILDNEKAQEESISFLAEMIKVNDSLWRKAIKLLNSTLEEKNVDVKDTLFLLKFTSDNKMKFEQFKLDVMKQQIELDRNAILVEELKKNRISSISNDDFIKKFIDAVGTEKVWDKEE
jgi:hypothetical protein